MIGYPLLLLILFDQNIFWKFIHSDPYRALCFDPLHTNPLGLFGDHLWPEVQSLTTDREISTEVDRRSVFYVGMLCLVT